MTPEKKDGNLWLNQDTYLSRVDLDNGNSINYKTHTQENGAYLFLIDGGIKVVDETLSKRDGIGIWDTDEFTIFAANDSQILIIEVPMN